MIPYTRDHLEHIRVQAKTNFDTVKGDWIEFLQWTIPYRARWLLSQNPGMRRNHHLVDTSHILSLRSFVAGFLEGNTSVTRPWFRASTGDRELDLNPVVHHWLDLFVHLCHDNLRRSNFYHASGEFYYDYGTVNTGAHFIEEKEPGVLHYHTLIPGSYYVINNRFGEAVVMVREMSENVKSLVEGYGTKVNGDWNWDNFSPGVKKMYEDANYNTMVDLVQIIIENPEVDLSRPMSGGNRRWMAITYETGRGQYGPQIIDGNQQPDSFEGSHKRYVSIEYSDVKPFVVGKSYGNGNFEYGEVGPTYNAIGAIKSLNKKAISKDIALEHMIKPPLQGPANLRKNYVTTAPNSYVPLDAHSLSQKGLRTIFEVNPAIGAVIQDVDDIRKMVGAHYFEDYLLYLSKNPKTRTATETDAVVQERQLVIGPNLQSLNHTYNEPHAEFIMRWTLRNDPRLPEIPEELAGRFLRPEFISVFAQAQRAADLPQVERYLAFINNVGQINPSVFLKANLDKIADIYEDRLYLPAGINRPQEEVEALKQQAQMEAQRRQQLEALTQVSGAAKNLGVQANQGQQ